MHPAFARVTAPYVIAPTTVEDHGLRLVLGVEADGLIDTATKVHCITIDNLDADLLGRRLAALATVPKAWLKNVGEDGRIHGALVHIGAPHSRAKYLDPNLAQVPNPKKGKPYGHDLFRANGDWVFVAADQASLQEHGLAHYLTPYDGGAYGRAFAANEDTHWRSAIALDLVAQNTARIKDDKAHTAIREGAKRFRNAFLYGAQAARAGHIITTPHATFSNSIRRATSRVGFSTLRCGPQNGS